MKKELDEELVRLCPNLYANRNKPPTVSPIGRGFECGDGWFELIKELSVKIEELILANTDASRVYVADQVKSKFGELRFYMSSETEEMTKLINEAERKSMTICQTCGKDGKLGCFKRGYWFVACKEDAVK